MVKVLIPSGALGLGYDKVALERALAAKPDIIAIDGGSTDSGPSYLGRGVSKYARSSTKIEWAGLMEARAKAGIPLVIGTAGTCGSDSAVDWLLDITKEIAAERGEALKIAVLRSSQKPETILQHLVDNRILPMEVAPEISKELILSSTNIVALAGAEQIAAAIQTGADIVIAGRTTDTATIAALPLMHGCHAGGSWHGAKIGECGALCATNPQSGVILVDFDEEGFTVTPTADGAFASPHTVSAHMLYENSDPFILYEPGGHLDVTDAKYQQVDERSVRVTGSKWVPSEIYTVKLEGARISGYQNIILTLLRDRNYVEKIEKWTEDIEVKANAKIADRLKLAPSDYTIEMRHIGLNATLGEVENTPLRPAEIGVLAIVTAQDTKTADEISKILNPYLLHHPLTQEEEQPTFAFPFSPADISRGAVYEFCLNHLLVLNDPMEAFSIEVHETKNIEAG